MARWDAREIFSVDPKASHPFSCVGIAKSKNRECHKPIGKERRIKAGELLDELSALPLFGQGYNERRLKEKMKELLDKVLCGIHKNGGSHPQIEKVEREWWSKVETAQAAMRNDGGQQPAQMMQRRREYRPVADVAPAAAEWALQPLDLNPMGIADQIQILEERIARDEAERLELMVRAEEEEGRRAAERMQRGIQQEANRIREEREQMLRMDREFALRLAREEEEDEELRREEEARQQRAERGALRRVDNGRNVQMPYLLAAPQRIQPRPIQREVQRKPLGDCYSCLEPIRRNEDADWCRAECGQNICHGCLEEWSINQEGRELTCGVCRAVWKFEGA